VTRVGSRGLAASLTAMAVMFGEITDLNRNAVLALRPAREQEQFVSSVQDSLAEAADYSHTRLWYRAVFAEPNVRARRPAIV
jgi:hypothetical protein